MFKSEISVIALSVVLGAFVGAHLLHVQNIQEAREFYSRHPDSRIKEADRLCEELKSKEQKTFSLDGFLSSLDFCSDMFLVHCLPVPNSVKNQTDAQLYSNIGLDQLYEHMRDWMMRSVNQHDNVKARKLATLALFARGLGNLHNTNRETTFASDLNRINLFSEAERVLQELPPIEETVFKGGCSKESEDLSRLMELEYSLMSQRKYQQVVDIARTSEAHKYTGYYGLALVGLHRDREASQILSHELGSRESALEFGLFVELCKPTEMTRAKKEVLKKKAKQLQEAMMKDDWDNIAFLQLAADRLKYVGLDEESNEMTAIVIQTKTH